MHAPHDVLGEGGSGLLAEAVVLLGQDQPGDRQQLIGAVVGEVDMVGHPRGEAWIGLVEDVHPLLVAGEDHHQIVAVGLHHLQQDLDRLCPVIPLVFRTIEVVGLVDEQHTPHRLLQHLPGLRRRVADVLTHQIVAGGGHHVALAHVTEAVEDLRHPLGHRGLAGARVAGERHVQAGRGGVEAHLLTGPVHHQQGGDLADARLDRPQADQLTVELVEHRLDAGAFVGGPQVDRGVVGGNGPLRGGHRRRRRRWFRLRPPPLPPLHPRAGG